MAEKGYYTSGGGAQKSVQDAVEKAKVTEDEKVKAKDKEKADEDKRVAGEKAATEEKKVKQEAADVKSTEEFRKELETGSGKIKTALEQGAKRSRDITGKLETSAEETKKETKKLQGEYAKEQTKGATESTAAGEQRIKDIAKVTDLSTEAGQKYLETTKELMKQTQELSKWQEGLSTSYQGIAQRYKDAFSESEELRKADSARAQRDYGANAAMMSKAAAVGMGGQGPMTGAQQQLMMSTAQQQATTAYSTAQDRIAAADQQRQILAERMVTAAGSQELQNKQAGFNMGAGIIQAQSGLNTQDYNTRLAEAGFQDAASANTYGVTMTGIQNRDTAATNIYNTGMANVGNAFGLDQTVYGAKTAANEVTTNAATYGGQADMAIAGAVNQQAMGMRGMREGVYAGEQALTESSALTRQQMAQTEDYNQQYLAALANQPEVEGPSGFSTGLTRALTGAAAGFTASGANPVGAVIGGGLGFLSAFT